MARGSSPLTRGKRKKRSKTPSHGRLIPAHAGKTVHSQDRSGQGAAHPRSRGENSDATPAKLRVFGSSPLTRGKPWCKPCLPRHLGLIPAHAGKTVFMMGLSVSFGAHPRSRGENPKTRSDSFLDPGSSPLTRGKPDLHQVIAAKRRLIPAHAGKTFPQGRRRPRVAAHPRSRGENASKPL